MAQFHESIRNALSEFDKFLEALKSEKLSKKLLSNKDKLIELLKKLRDDYPALAPTPTNDIEGSDGSAGRVSNLSVGAADEDDYAYTENVPEVAVKDLTNAVKMGYLEKKRKKATLLQSAYQKRFCVIHNKTFYYYEKSKDVKQSGAFFLEGYEFREAPQHVKEAAKKELSFEMVAPGKRSYQFLAESKEEFQSWRVIIESGGEPTGSSDIPIEGEFDDIYEDMEEVAEQVKTLSATTDVPQPNGDKDDQEVYDDAESATKADEEIIGEMDEVYDDVGNVEKSLPAPEKPTEKPPPVPPPMRSKPSLPLPDLPPPPPPFKQDQPLPALPCLPDLPPPRPTKPIPRPKLELSINPLEDYENMYYGKWDWKADSDEELSFKHGEIVHVINREFDNKDWWVGRIDEKYGLVPKHYLIRAYKAMG
ncbi:src kinase-associated phosphoprotein 2-B-like isoform X2 [Haliotis rufescens]|uniref:src kinase-associated phosphoprotein 2-B-like isoform X2 n=1 Tax=Haliotis rufescens TaxID=6454 RepID=UPI001EB043C7|nr:src kinase-associated phosphoprotein 2-B-like isoform X2 [Haliotis rufescens]